MTQEVKLFQPLDVVGVDYSRPSTEVLWRKLTNVWIDDGAFVQRPGLRPVGSSSPAVGSRSVGVPTVIAEAVNWADEDTSYGVIQVLVPDSTIANTNWDVTGSSAHEAVDESPPDYATSYISSDDDGASIEFGFGNLSSSPEFVDLVILHVRARAGVPAEQSLSLFYGNGTQDGVLIETVRVTGTEYDDNESAVEGFIDYLFAIPKSQNAGRWSPALVNSLNLKLVYNQESSPVGTLLAGNTTGQDDDFVQQDGSASSDSWKYGSGNEIPEWWDVDAATFVRGDVGDRISIQMDAWSDPSWTTIDKVTVTFALAIPPFSIPPGKVTIYFVSGGTRYTVATGLEVTRELTSPNDAIPDAHGCRYEWVGGNNPGWSTVQAEMTTNPATAAAWTAAQLEGNVEFGIEVETGSSRIYLNTVHIFVQGTDETSLIEIDQVQLLPLVRQTTATEPQVQLGRVLGSTSSFYRLENQIHGADDSYVDILSSADVPAGGLIWDWCEFIGSLYFENSVNDTWSFAGSGANMANLTTGLPIGHTLWTFGQRLFKGDITDSGTRYPKRLAHTVLADPDDWTGAGSGTIDLTFGGEGRIRKGLALSSHISALYLDKGIYTLRWTGDDDAPFVAQFVDGDTGIVAPRTCIALLDSAGIQSHVFLGRGPDGLGVYVFNGQDVQHISQEIDAELKRLVNYAQLDFAFAGLDRKRNLLHMFVPEEDQIFPRQSWVYHIDTGHWTRWEYPVGMTCAGEWTLVKHNKEPPYEYEVGDGLGFTKGEKHLCVGTSHGHVMRFEEYAGGDWLNVAGDTSTRTVDNDYLDSLSEVTSPDEQAINVVIQSGYLALGELDMFRMTSMVALWFAYEDRGRLVGTLDESITNGTDFETDDQLSFQLGGTQGGRYLLTDSPRPVRVANAPFKNPKDNPFHMFRLQFDTDGRQTRQFMRIAKMGIEYQQGANS